MEYYCSKRINTISAIKSVPSSPRGEKNINTGTGNLKKSLQRKMSRNPSPSDNPYRPSNLSFKMAFRRFMINHWITSSRTLEVMEMMLLQAMQTLEAESSNPPRRRRRYANREREVSLLNHSALNSPAPEPNEIETSQTGNEQKNEGQNEAAADASHQTEESGSVGKTESDSDLESELSRGDLVKLVAEKEQLLATKQEELEQMKDKVLKASAEMENVKERTRRESENAKKFAIQNFAKSLLDVADNLGRASSAMKESFSKIYASKDPAEAVQQLKTLLEGVEMTEKQLNEVFKNVGLEKYETVNEEFDPNRHNVVFQVPDASKPANHVAVVLKSGYVLHDRVIRPAEVGVTVGVDNEEADKGSVA